MPIYEYQCENCGKYFEIFQRIADEPLKQCQACKGKLNKLISQCSFQLKGTGWYVTDYKKPIDSAGGNTGPGNGSKQSEKAETISAAKTETPAETTTETKTAATTGG